MVFNHSVILITGSSRGIGRAVAHAFSQKGARVAVHFNKCDREAQDTLKMLDGIGHGIFSADITKPDQAQNLVLDVINEMGELSILVNNAGIYETNSIADVSYSFWQKNWHDTLGVNLVGASNVTYSAVEHMMKLHRGKIINISSRGAFRGEPNAPAYAASKAGLNAFSQSMAQALAPHNIFVYVVAPGFVDTDMAFDVLSSSEGESIRKQSPLGRIALPEEVANTVVFLASEGTDYLTGCILDVNGASYLRS